LNKNSKIFRRKLRIFAALFFAAAILGVIFVWNIGGVLVAPANRPVGDPPKTLPVQSVEFPSASGAKICGWFIVGQPGKGAVILMHGVHANRLGMVNRAELLFQNGYSVLLFDFQAHGESIGKQITFGYLESRDATAAVNFVHQKLPAEKVCVIGVSMGAASALLANPPLKVNAMVLESSYPTIKQAVEDRMAIRFGIFGKLAAPLLTWQLKPRLRFGVDDLCPIQQVGKITVPKFFIAGTADRDTTLPESQALFDAAAEPKQLWLVDGAAHVDMLAFARAEYEKRVLAFLAKNLN
jgi:alpha-beta hydrolase superfamily lysophospholipase